MVDSPPLLIVWHSRTGGAQALARKAAEGAGENARLMPAAEAGADDVLAARGYLFVCPENLATMSGMMKEFFDRTYYDLLGRIEGRAYATIVAAGSDGTGAQAQIDRIAKGWRLRRVADPMIVDFAAQTREEILADKVVNPSDAAAARDLGAAMGEGLAEGMF